MEREFKGVWIPKEIWLNSELTMIEKVIYTEIESLDNENHCTAGNEYFAKFCNCSERVVTSAIKHLQELGLIEVISFDGRHRKLIVRGSFAESARQYSKNCEAVSQNLRSINIYNNTINNRKSLIGKNPIKDIPKNQAPEIDTFVKLYNELCPNLPRCIKHTESRDRAISKIVKKYSLEDIRTVFTKANNSEFLTGKNDRGWTASIDFLLRDDKFVSILEGKYDGKQRSNVSSEEPVTEDRRANKKKFWEDVKNGKAEKF